MEKLSHFILGFLIAWAGFEFRGIVHGMAGAALGITDPTVLYLVIFAVIIVIALVIHFGWRQISHKLGG